MSYRHTEELHAAFRKKRAAIRRRLREYRAVPVSGYFYELVYCLMTPQSSAVNAAKAQQRFEEADLLHREIDPEPFLFTREYYIRFHRTKARHITEMKRNYALIEAVTIGPMTAEEKREWFVRNVKGLSYKEATHFLRNIGRNDGLAILDRHILKNLRRYGVIRSIPATLTKKRYLSIERKFRRFAEEAGITVDELDLLFWSAEAGEILK
ncbi:MAG: DNA lyase [Bacteroidetes bacterium]|nr:DNA lyase [Bacteroidota bacterium]